MSDEESTAIVPQDTASLSGSQKGLLFLMSLDESIATKVMAQLDNQEVASLRSATESIQQVDFDIVVEINREFIELVSKGVPTDLKGSTNYLRRLATKALGEKKVAQMWGEESAPSEPVRGISELDADKLAGLLASESPQTIAVVLSLIEHEKSAKLLNDFDKEKKIDIVMRMTKLEKVPQSVVEDIEQQLISELDGNTNINWRKVGGQDTVASLLKKLDSETADEILQKIHENDAAMAEKLQKSLFGFEDLRGIDDRGIQSLLKSVANDRLIIALKGTSEGLKDKILRNMSSRAATNIEEELEFLGPTKLSDVEEAQQEIVGIAMDLEKEGKIIIARDGEDGYV